MNRKTVLPVIFILWISVQNLLSQAENKPFVHPGMAQTRADLEVMKQKVLNGEQPWKGAFDRLSKSASLEFGTEPFTHVVRGSYGSEAVGGSELSSGATQAYNHALLWYITGNRAHARKAIEIINTWSGTVWDFEGNDAKLLAGWTGHDFCNAAEILRYSDSGWDDKDIGKFKNMLLSVYYPLIKDFFPEANGNWDGSMIHTMLCIGVFCDDRHVFDRAVDHFLRGNGNGGITKYIYPDGQCQESTRDMGHTQLGLGEFAGAAMVAWNQGLDLFGAADNRIALGYEYTARYMLGEEVKAIGVISSQGRDRFRNIYEGVLEHYRFSKGFEMPYTSRAFEKTSEGLPVGILTSYRGKAGKLVFSPGNNPLPSKYASEAGALFLPSSEPPANSIFVKPGESVQSALDQAAGTGRWVVLEKGIHRLGAAVRLPGGITLAGRGLETVLFLDPDVKRGIAGPAIINAAPEIRDIVLRDFVIEGAVTTRTSSDPNQDRRTRSYQNAPGRAGIILSGLSPGQMENIRFEHITVRNCTHQGVAVRGARKVTIIDCDFSDNGSSVVPGKGLQHNLQLTYSEDCNISGSRLDGSPFGCGISFVKCKGISVGGCELARNALHGVWLADCTRAWITGNLVEGNDSCGIIADKFYTGSSEIYVTDNVSRNNGSSGITFSSVDIGEISGNRMTDNGEDNREKIVKSGRLSVRQ